MRVVVDAALCCGHGLCVAAVPSLFTLDDDGFNTLAGDESPVPAEQERVAADGARACPESAIQLLP